MRVGVVGAGFMGSVHLDAYAGMPEVDVAGVADSNAEAAAVAAATAGARPYATYEELVAYEDVDVVDLCPPTVFHRNLALQAARDGKHVILEKPIALTLGEADEILEAFEHSDGRLFVGHVVRFFPEYARIKRMLDAGDLGTVGVVRTSRRSPLLMGWNDWYADQRASGGVLVDLLIHDFDFLRWCFGEVERVYARGVLGREYNRLDYALVTLRFEGGEISHLEGHWGYPGPFNYSIEVAGSKALVTADSTEPASLRLAGGARDPGHPPNLTAGKNPYAKELEHFIGCIASGEEAVVSAWDARAALAISQAAIESIRTGKPVKPGGTG